MQSLDHIARRCFEIDLETQKNNTKTGCIGLILVPIFAFLGMVIAATSDMDVGGGVLFLIIGGVIGWCLTRLISPPSHSLVRTRLERFRSGDIAAVMQVHSFAVAYFREQILIHRNRTLGEDSEWGRARASLVATLDEARQQKAYWHARHRNDIENDMAKMHYGIASRLHEKMDRAMKKLESRADVLLRFYAECEAKVDLLDHHNQDMVKARQLESLSDRADVVIAEAEGTLSAIGQNFVREAQTVWQAMSGLGEVQTLTLAGEAALDDMEFLADRVIERAEMDEKTIRDLETSLSNDWRPGGSNPSAEG